MNTSEYTCNLIIPGVGKSGTSSLHVYLDAHPAICMSSRKEPHFFSIDSRWEKGPLLHNSLFSRSKPEARIFGESSTTYFASEIAIERIKRSLAKPRIVIVLRNPVDRVISHYRWMYALGLETRCFSQAISQSGYGFDPNVPIHGNYMSYLEFSLYSKWVPRWKDNFGANNVLILRADDLSVAPVSVINHCCSFFGISNFLWDLPDEQNKTEDALAKSENPLSVLIKAYIPSSMKQSMKATAPRLVSIWDRVFIKYRKIVPPRITEEERRIVESILEGESEYFSCVPHATSEIGPGS